MAFEDVQAELSLLVNQMDDPPEDRFELLMQIHEKLNELKAFGMPLPDDLVQLEKSLGDQVLAEQAKAAESEPNDAPPS